MGRVALVQAQLLVVMMIVVLQLWLLTVALEELLAGQTEGLVLVAVTSGLGFLVAMLVLWAGRAGAG